MNNENSIRIALGLALSGPIVWLVQRIFLDVVSPVTVVLCALLVCVALTAILVLARGLPATARRRGVKHASLIGLLLVAAFLVRAWRQEYLHDTLLFLPLALVVILLTIGPLLILAWGGSALMLGSARLRTGAAASFFTSHLAGRLFTCAITACLIVFLLLPWMWVLQYVDLARATRMKSRHRALWVALVCASDERVSVGRAPLWPKDLGFTGSETSTAYFRRLLAPEAGQVVERRQDWLVPDLSFWALGGPGLREAAAAKDFGPENNAWQVVCIGEDADAGAPFLISRNVDFGDTLTPTSQVRFIRSGPLRLRQVVWLTHGGGIFAASFHTFTSAMLFRDIYDDADPSATSAIYRVMRP